VTIDPGLPQHEEELVSDLLRSWNEGPAKAAIINFVHATTDPASADFVPEKDRFATFDQDGTLWVEHPFYTQLAFALHRLAELAPQRPSGGRRSRSSPRFPVIPRLLEVHDDRP